MDDVASNTTRPYMLLGWQRIYRLARYVKQRQPQTAAFLGLFFIFSDGYATIPTVAVLFAYRELCMSALSLIVLSIMVPLFAAVGGYLWLKFQTEFGWGAKDILVLNLGLIALLPLWGCLGFFTEEVGLHHPWELYMVGVIFGRAVADTARNTLWDAIVLQKRRFTRVSIT